MKKRDESLDRLRAFAILWTILVHVLYWGEFYSSADFELWRSFLLLEMPLIFFVTGAGNSMGREEAYGSFVRRRYIRMLIPYWAFAAICVVISLLDYPSYLSQNTSFVWQVIFSWLLPLDSQMTQLPYLTWALWFVPVYLGIVLLIPVLRKLRRFGGAFWLIPLTAIFIGATYAQQDYLQKVTFYAIWTYLGMFYSDIRKAAWKLPGRLLLAAAAACGVAALIWLQRQGAPNNMQNNKFPPNRMFLLFSCTVMCGVGAVWRWLDAGLALLQKTEAGEKFLKLYATRSMTIFLYQVLVFPLVIYTCNILFPGTTEAMAVFKSVLCFVLTAVICALCAAWLGRIEEAANQISKIKSLKISIEWREE